MPAPTWYTTQNLSLSQVSSNVLTTTTKEEFRQFFASDGDLANMIGAVFYPAFSVSFGVDVTWPTVPASGGPFYYTFCFPFLLPNLGQFMITITGTITTPSGSEKICYVYGDYDDDFQPIPDYYTWDSYDVMTDSGCMVFWPMRRFTAGFTISTTATENFTLSSIDSLPISPSQRTYYNFAPGTWNSTAFFPNQSLPPLFSNLPNSFISATSVKALQRWCDVLLYTPLLLWVHNSTPLQTKHTGIVCPTNIRGSSTYTPVGYVGRSVYSVVHWVPFREGCPDFCNKLYISVTWFTAYKEESTGDYDSAPTITVIIGQKAFTKTMTLWQEQYGDANWPYEDDCGRAFFLARFDWDGDDGSKCVVGGRDYWPVQITDIDCKYAQSSGGSKDYVDRKCVQAMSAWLGGGQLI